MKASAHATEYSAASDLLRVRVRVRVGPFRCHERVRVVELGRRPDREDDHHAGRPLPRGTALHAVLAEGEWDREYAACGW